MGNQGNEETEDEMKKMMTGEGMKISENEHSREMRR